MTKRFDLGKGVVQVDVVSAKLARGALQNDIVAATTEYTLFVPYIPMILFPEVGSDPVLYAQPSELIYWQTDPRLFELGPKASALGITPCSIFGVPKADWPKVETVALSMMVKGWPTDNYIWHFITQRMQLCLRGRNGHVSIELFGFAVESAHSSFVYTPSSYYGIAPAIPSRYTVKHDYTIFDPNLTEFAKNIGI